MKELSNPGHDFCVLLFLKSEPTSPSRGIARLAGFDAPAKLPPPVANDEATHADEPLPPVASAPSAVVARDAIVFEPPTELERAESVQFL